MSNPGLPVAGYVSQSDANVAVVNENKIMEERLLRQVEKIRDTPGYDGRFTSIAFTHFQEGFMMLNRAVFKPERIQLPEDQ